MRRREFLGVVGGAAAWPMVARAQPQTGRLPTIGFFGAATPAAWGHWVAAFVKRLNELGWIEGRTVVIEYRWAEGNPQRFKEIAAELIQLKVDVIFAVGTEAALVAKQATTTIPIVFPVAGDPIGTSLVASLARPGGNVTGLSDLVVDLASKRLDLLREVLPSLKRLGVLANPA
jgi:putative tryptophan/tyrosine transport system substrate-binding protein